MRSARRLVTWGLGLLVALAGVLTAWEWYRRENLAILGLSSLLTGDSSARAEPPAFDPTALKTQLSNPDRFRSLIESIRARVAAMDVRHRSHDRTENHHMVELDKEGTVVASQRGVEEVYFEKGDEWRRVVEKIEEPSGKPVKGISKKPKKSEPLKETFPCSVPAEKDDYIYTLEEIEQVDGAWGIRLGFKPGGSPVRRFTGQLWVDPVTFEPRRLYVVLAEKKPFVDQFSMLIDYGPVDGIGVVQRRCVIDGSGGFAMIQKHYRSTIEFTNYRPTKP